MVASVIVLRSVNPLLGQFVMLAVFWTTLMVSVGSSFFSLVSSDVLVLLQRMMTVISRWLTTLGRSARIPGRAVPGPGTRGGIPLHLQLVLCLPIVGFSSMVLSVCFLISPFRS